jgi:hypothetical protein
MTGLDLEIKVLNTDMLMGREKKIEDNIPLSGRAKPFVSSKVIKDFLFFQYHAPLLIDHGIQYDDYDEICQADFLIWGC